MTFPKKTAVKASKTTAPSKPVAKKARAVSKSATTVTIKEKIDDELVVDNIASLSKVVQSLGVTLEMLVQKVESMAHHVIASEEILAELVATNGLNLAHVNARIRAKIAAGTDNAVKASQAIDAAAAIASPLPRR